MAHRQNPLRQRHLAFLGHLLELPQVEAMVEQRFDGLPTVTMEDHRSLATWSLPFQAARPVPLLEPSVAKLLGSPMVATTPLLSKPRIATV
jgi:hypothetical protein